MVKILMVFIFISSFCEAQSDSNIVLTPQTYAYVMDTLYPTYKDSMQGQSFNPIPVTNVSSPMSAGDSLIVINGYTLAVGSTPTMWLLSSAYAYESNPAYSKVLNYIAQSGKIGYFITKQVEIIYKKTE